MSPIFKLKKLFFSLLLIALTTGSVFAAYNFRAPQKQSGGFESPANNASGPVTVDVWSNCKKVSNSSSNSYFIPTNTANEWSTFQSKAPSGIGFSACCQNPTCTDLGKNCGTVNIASYPNRCNDTIDCGGCNGITTCDGNWRCVATRLNGDGTYSLVTTSNPYRTATNGIYTGVAQSCNGPSCNNNICGTRSYNDFKANCGIGKYCQTSTATCQPCDCKSGDLSSTCSPDTFSQYGFTSTTIYKKARCGECFFDGGYNLYKDSACTVKFNLADVPCASGFYKWDALGTPMCSKCTSSTCGYATCQNSAICPGSWEPYKGTNYAVWRRKIGPGASDYEYGKYCYDYDNWSYAPRCSLDGNVIVDGQRMYGKFDTAPNCSYDVAYYLGTKTVTTCPKDFNSYQCIDASNGATQITILNRRACNNGSCSNTSETIGSQFYSDQITSLNCGGNNVLMGYNSYNCSGNTMIGSAGVTTLSVCSSPSTTYYCQGNDIWKKSGGGCSNLFLPHCVDFTNTKESTCPSGLTKCQNGKCVNTVICTEMHRIGAISDKWYQADSQYAEKYMDKETMLGYHIWALPLVTVMQENPEVLDRIKPIAIEWAHSMAFQTGLEKTDSQVGKILLEIGVPLCKKIGEYIQLNGLNDQKISTEIMEKLALKYLKLYSSEDLTQETTLEEIKTNTTLFLNEVQQEVIKLNK